MFRDYQHQPSTISLWTDLSSRGDGMRQGRLISAKNLLFSDMRGMDGEDGEDNTTATPLYEIEVGMARQKEKHSSRKLSRLEAVKALFHAFVGRTEAYDLPHHIGLISFGATAEEIPSFFLVIYKSYF